MTENAIPSIPYDILGLRGIKVMGYRSFLEAFDGQHARGKLGFPKRHAQGARDTALRMDQMLAATGFAFVHCGMNRTEAVVRAILRHEPTGYLVRLQLIDSLQAPAKLKAVGLWADTFADERVFQSSPPDVVNALAADDPVRASLCVTLHVEDLSKVGTDDLLLAAFQDYSNRLVRMYGSAAPASAA